MPRLQLAALVLLALVAGQVRAQNAISAKAPAGDRVASADGKKINITDTKTNKLLISISAHTDDITALAYSPDGKSLASADKTGKVNLFDAATGRATLSLKANAGTNRVAFSADGRKLEVKAPVGMRTFDVATGKEVK